MIVGRVFGFFFREETCVVQTCFNRSDGGRRCIIAQRCLTRGKIDVGFAYSGSVAQNAFGTRDARCTMESFDQRQTHIGVGHVRPEPYVGQV